MKYTYLIFIVLLTACQATDKNAQPIPADTLVVTKPQPSPMAVTDIVAWLRKGIPEIGCTLESTFGFRDSVFNCSLRNYVNKGDPCNNSEAYYEGVNLPDSLAYKLQPAVKSFTFDFEGGKLRQVFVTFKDSVLITDITKWFTLPAKENFPGNIIDIDYGESTFSNDKPVDKRYTRWLKITGFEHQGAGDVDCD